MRKVYLIFGFICVFFLNIDAQKISPEVISTSGDYFKKSNGSLSWTIGESITGTYTNGTTLIQGFQQSGILSVSVFELEDVGNLVKIAPNPATDFINLYVNNYKDINYQLYDINGRLIKQSNVYSDETIISFSELSYATYFLKIMKGSQSIKTFQIIKQ